MAKRTCLRGHPYTNANTVWGVGTSGKPQRSCRRCKNEQQRQRYHADAVYRERKKAATKHWYHCKGSTTEGDQA